MTFLESGFQGPTPYYREESRIIRAQKAAHPEQEG